VVWFVVVIIDDGRYFVGVVDVVGSVFVEFCVVFGGDF